MKFKAAVNLLLGVCFYLYESHGKAMATTIQILQKAVYLLKVAQQNTTSGLRKMKDKRKIKRRFLRYYTRVYDAYTRQQIGNLVDINPRGKMVVSEHLLPQGENTRLCIELTDEVTEKPFMEFSAHNKWCKPDIIPNMFNTGYEILDLTPENSKIIHQIIQEFGFRDN